MSNDPLRLLVDTNVWLDNYIPTRAGHAAAVDLFTHARTRNMQLLYPVEAIKDVFYLMSAHFKADARAAGLEVNETTAAVARSLAWDCVNNMREVACAVGADGSDVWLAAKYRTLHEDLEDNLVLAAAKRAHADWLITGDRALAAKSPVPTMSPADWLALQE